MKANISTLERTAISSALYHTPVANQAILSSLPPGTFRVHLCRRLAETLATGFPAGNTAELAHQAGVDVIEVVVLSSDLPDGALVHHVKRLLAARLTEASILGEDITPWAAAITATSNFTSGIKDSEWPDPSPLPEGLPTVKPLEPEMIPLPLRGWLMDISDRLQIPPDFSTAATVVALGSIIGRGCGIHPKRHDDWLVVPNLWGAVVGRPSLMKTPAMMEAFRHLTRLENEAKGTFEAETSYREATKEVAKAERAAIIQDITKAVKAGRDTHELKCRLTMMKLEDPTRQRYQTQDGTTEKIGELLNQNARGLLVNRDELIGWLRALERDGREGDRGFYLEAWNGSGSFTYDRIGRGTLDIMSLCLSVFGAITPGNLSDYVYQATRGGRGDDGLLQRFQVIVWPDDSKEWKNVDRFPITTERERAWRIFQTLATNDISGATIGEHDTIPALRFSPDAQEVFNQWRHELEARLRGDSGLSPTMESHLAKYRSLMPSLSLIFHLVSVVDGCEPVGPVSENAAKMAVAWCSYLESHAARIYGGTTSPGMESAKEIIKHIRRGDIKDGDTVRSIYRGREWSKLTGPEEVKAGLSVLEDYDWLTVEKVTNSKGGRPSEAVKLNPKVTQYS